MNKKSDLHERARRLIDVERVEGLAAEERQWLEAHLAACEDCARWAEEAESVLLSLKSISLTLPPGLADVTRQRVREKARELRQRRARNLALISACALSWLMGLASAPFIWKLCAWVGPRFALPRVVWQMAFFFWWLMPAAAIGAVILLMHGRRHYGLNFPDSDGI